MIGNGSSKKKKNRKVGGKPSETCYFGLSCRSYEDPSWVCNRKHNAAGGAPPTKKRKLNE